MKVIRDNFKKPFRLVYPTGFNQWVRDTLPASLIYDRFKKELYCERCGCHRTYTETIRSRDIVACPNCGEELRAIPHTNKNFVREEAMYILFYELEGELCWSEIYAYRKVYIHNDDYTNVMDAANDIKTEVTNMGRLSHKGEKCYRFHYRWSIKDEAYTRVHVVNDEHRPSGWSGRLFIQDNAKEVMRKVFPHVKLESIFITDQIRELSIYARYPSAEYIYKSGLGEYIYNKVFNWSTYIRPNWRAKSAAGFLRLTPQDVDKLRAWKCLNVEGIAIYHKIKQWRNNPKKDELEIVGRVFMASELYYKSRYITNSLMTTDPDIVKIARYIKRQAEKYEEQISAAYYIKYKHLLKDYWDMCLREDMSLEDDYYRYPKNLEERHDALSNEIAARKAEEEEKRIKHEQEYFTKELLPKLQKFDYRDEHYIIRALRSYQEMVQEGHRMKNCIGSNYAAKAIEGKTKLFTMRHADSPDEVYISLELSVDNKSIVQCYETGNRLPKPEAEEWAQKWLKEIVNKNRSV